MTAVALSSSNDLTDVLSRGSPGASDVAAAIFRQIDKVRHHARQNASDWRTLVKTRVFGLRKDATEQLGADDVIVPDQQSVLFAAKFVDALPFHLVSPSVALDSDGEISLDWWFGPYAQLSISIGPTGKLTYAGLIGREGHRHGVELFRDRVPEVLLVTLAELERRFASSSTY